MKREIIRIDEEKCNGCGICVPNCHEGALQIIDSKAVMVSELMCDGLGACIGHCPEGALTIEKREAEPYDEEKVMKEMIGKGKNVIIAHLKHLKEHNEDSFLKQGIRFLWDNKVMLNFNPAEVVEAVYNLPPKNEEFEASPFVLQKQAQEYHSCPGSGTQNFGKRSDYENSQIKTLSEQVSELNHWPIQLHLINPSAEHFAGCDLLLSADCVAFSLGNFHDKFLKNKKLVIACPKLDHGMEIYVEKITRLIDESGINTITVIRMEVPCCGGLLQIVKLALQRTRNRLPVKEVVVSVSGEIIKDEWSNQASSQ